MKVILLFLMLVGAGFLNAQEVVDKKKSKNETHDFPASNLDVSDLGKMVGVTKLTANTGVLTDSSFVNYLQNDTDYDVQERSENKKTYKDYRWSKGGVCITTLRTGFDAGTLDEFIAEIDIYNRKNRRLPFGGNVNMTYKEYKKKLTSNGFKYDKCVKSEYSKTYKSYIFERSNATVEIFYEGAQFHRMSIIANLEYIYGGRLIK